MLPKPHALEYTIFGKFRMQAGGSSFKDTYFFTLSELSQGGQSKAKLKEALLAYEGLQAAAECAALGDVSTDDEAGEEEEEREERVERVASGEQAAVGGDGVEDSDDDDSDDSDDGSVAAGGYGLVPE